MTLHRDDVASGMRTFDVFETALVRRVGVPSSVFLLLGGEPEVRGITGLSEHAFAELRKWSQVDRRLADPSGETSLDEIYRVLVRDLGIDDDLRGPLVESELVLEANLLAPNPTQAMAVAEARRSQGRVIWLSDTYLPSAWIADQLRRHGLLEP